MNKRFKAGDIQKILGITKTRYAYIVRETNITPELEVIGTGKAHEYSLKNLLQIGFAHYALDFLSIRQTRSLLDFLNDDKQAPSYIFNTYATPLLVYFAIPKESNKEPFFYCRKYDGKGKAYIRSNKNDDPKAIKFIDVDDGDQIQQYMLNIGIVKYEILIKAGNLAE